MTMKKYLVGSMVLVVAIIGTMWWFGRVTHLDAPLNKIDKTNVGKQTLLTGIAYPNAHIAVYVDDQFTQDIPVSPDGTFVGTVSFAKEGVIELKTKQLYGNISSEFSDVVTLQVDLTPPNRDSFQLNSEIPSFSKEPSLVISGKINPTDKILINGVPYVVASDGSFSGVVTLTNGENTLNFSLSDEVGNTVQVDTYKVAVDNIPPKVNTTFCGSKTLSASDFNSLATGQEYVCLSVGQWEDWRDPALVPIVGFVQGDIGSMTVDGKQVYADENDEIYRRILLSVPKGLNKYKVVVTDKYGNQTSTSLTMTVESVRSSGYDDVIDRLDNIEGSIDNLQ